MCTLVVLLALAMFSFMLVLHCCTCCVSLFISVLNSVWVCLCCPFGIGVRVPGLALVRRPRAQRAGGIDLDPLRSRLGLFRFFFGGVRFCVCAVVSVCVTVYLLCVGTLFAAACARDFVFLVHARRPE